MTGTTAASAFRLVSYLIRSLAHISFDEGVKYSWKAKLCHLVTWLNEV